MFWSSDWCHFGEVYEFNGLKKNENWEFCNILPYSERSFYVGHKPPMVLKAIPKIITNYMCRISAVRKNNYNLVKNKIHSRSNISKI